MSSLVRRSLRTTVAAAGIAAVGVGLAGPAFAAPELPAAPGTDGLADASTAPAAPTTPEMPSTDSFVLPGIVNFEMPTVSTAAPALPAFDAFEAPAVTQAPAVAEAPAAPAAPEAPALPDSPTDSLDFEYELGESDTEDVEPRNEMGAMQALDMAATLMEMAQGAAAGDSPTENQQIG